MGLPSFTKTEFQADKIDLQALWKDKLWEIANEMGRLI